MTPTIDAPTRTTQTSSAVSAPVEVLEWVHEAAAWLTPREVVWCDGSPAEAQRLTATLVESGTFTPLNPEKRPGSYLARSEPSDVARVESRTFVCTTDPLDAGPTNNWVDPQAMKDTLRQVARGSMAGRTLYVVPFSMGPLDSPLSRPGVQITDSAYVALSLHTMVRVSTTVLVRIAEGASWTRCTHTVGAPLAEGEIDSAWPCNDTKYISHFPESNEIISFGSAYGGNALLPKKAFALRMASVLAKNEGWLAEHMLLVKVTSPEGKSYTMVAAFPSACGKTNFAMMQPSLPGWKIETLGDDIAWLAPGADGRLRAINPEAGFFGVAPGTSTSTNPVAMTMLEKNTVFTNVALTSDGDVWWEGMSKPTPEGLTNWRGQAHDPDSGEAAAHPNSRFTVGLEACPSLASEWDDPEGVVVDAIIFGGRRSSTVPLVLESRNWNHGVFLGATIASERTAAAEGEVGEVRRDPFAMLPFLGYNLGDYLQHWLSMGDTLRVTGRLPRIFQVNWFQKGEDGSFLWPGFGENSRVVEWMVDRLEGRVAAQDSPIGLLPKSLNTEGLNLDSSSIEALTSVDTAAVEADLDDAEEFLARCEDRLPVAITEELAATRIRLRS